MEGDVIRNIHTYHEYWALLHTGGEIQGGMKSMRPRN